MTQENSLKALLNKKAKTEQNDSKGDFERLNASNTVKGHRRNRRVVSPKRTFFVIHFFNFRKSR